GGFWSKHAIPGTWTATDMFGFYMRLWQNFMPLMVVICCTGIYGNAASLRVYLCSRLFGQLRTSGAWADGADLTQFGSSDERPDFGLSCVGGRSLPSVRRLVGERVVCPGFAGWHKSATHKADSKGFGPFPGHGDDFAGQPACCIQLVHRGRLGT